MNHHLIILQQVKLTTGLITNAKKKKWKIPFLFKAGLVRNPVPFDLEKNRPRKKGADEYGMVKLRPEHIYLRNTKIWEINYSSFTPSALMIHGGGVGCGLGMLILEWIWKKTGLGED